MTQTKVVRWFITTDTHFGHKNMETLCNRPPDFSERIFRNWKRNVKPDDWIIHLGDVSWPEYYDRLTELPGHKILTRGNHDQKSYTWYQNHGFDFVCESFTMRVWGLNVVFSHKPLVFHDADINIHGHLHALAEFNSVNPAYSLALEERGYGVFYLKDVVNAAHVKLMEHGMLGGHGI